jgi:hypothetical protein
VDNELSEAPNVKPKRKIKPVDVTIIKVVSGVARVQWRVGQRLTRGFVPVSVIQDSKVDEEELAAAAPYGVAWERFLRPAAVEIAEDLRREGIWTVADLVAVNPRAAFERFAGVLFGEFIRKVKE